MVILVWISPFLKNPLISPSSNNPTRDTCPQQARILLGPMITLSLKNPLTLPLLLSPRKQTWDTCPQKARILLEPIIKKKTYPSTALILPLYEPLPPGSVLVKDFWTPHPPSKMNVSNTAFGATVWGPTQRLGAADVLLNQKKLWKCLFSFC